MNIKKLTNKHHAISPAGEIPYHDYGILVREWGQGFEVFHYKEPGEENKYWSVFTDGFMPESTENWDVTMPTAREREYVVDQISKFKQFKKACKLKNR